MPLAGLRMQQWMFLEWRDIEEKVVRVRRKPGRWEVKARKDRLIPLHPSLAAELAEWHKERPKTKLVFGTKTAQVLKQSAEPQLRAMGAYLWGLVDRSSVAGRGAGDRERAKQGNIYRKDGILGRFRIDVTDPGFGELFYPRANRWHDSGLVVLLIFKCKCDGLRVSTIMIETGSQRD